MAETTFAELTEETAPHLDSVIAISELTNPLIPLSRKVKISNLLAIASAQFTAQLTAFKNAHEGYVDIGDLTTQTVPLVGVSGVTQVIPNDAALSIPGSPTDLPTGVTTVWNPISNAFDFTQLGVGDRIQLRLDLEIVTSTPSQNVKVNIEFNQAPGTPFSLELIDSSYKTAGNHKLHRHTSFYLGSADVVANPTQFKIVSDGNFTLQVNGWYIEINRKAT